ncbi:hypothetical protein CBR_g51273 [Chara braunii]|uniref:GATA-type domain-containing protein n=1 Tax=Chara braunii TaxID=69332 RepID=A0A388M848_CHABU|nr:hypothetical protein CBR_g51273 [Chara braunii]|eukprot:GBG90767.1 hypothetical protein CBR_g51273 [Chara braunii]
MTLLTRSQTAGMDQKANETGEAYEARLAAIMTESKQRAEASAAARKTREAEAERLRQITKDQRQKHAAAAAKDADEERVRRREILFREETALHAQARDWRQEAENGDSVDYGTRIALLLNSVTDLLATCMAQQEDIHSLDHANQALTKRIQQLEQRPVATSSAGPSDLVDRVNILEIDVGTLKTETQRLDQQATCAYERTDEIGLCFLHTVAAAKSQPTDLSSDPRVVRLLDEFADIFESPTGVVPDRPISQEVILEAGVVLPKGCIYRMSEEQLTVLRAELDDLLDKGWIRPSSSPYGAPVLFVQKKNKDLRLCIDYRKLNAQTVKNAGPLPRIGDLLERLGDAEFFSKLDLKSGYHQISIRPQDRYKTAFKTWCGHFEWVVMPFGLTNAPTTFRAAMTNEFRAMLDWFVLVFLIYSRTLEEHLEHLRRVLETLRRAKYKAIRDKCKFVRQELEYLGHFVTPQGISPLSDKIQAIQDWPEPRNITDVRSFLGLAGYYQRFIKGYSKITAHLSKLQCEDRPFDFGTDVRESFLALKAALLSAEVLRIYDRLLPTRVTTDASGYGIGHGVASTEEKGEALRLGADIPEATGSSSEARRQQALVVQGGSGGREPANAECGFAMASNGQREKGFEPSTSAAVCSGANSRVQNVIESWGALSMIVEAKEGGGHGHGYEQKDGEYEREEDKRQCGKEEQAISRDGVTASDSSSFSRDVSGLSKYAGSAFASCPQQQLHAYNTAQQHLRVGDLCHIHEGSNSCHEPVTAKDDQPTLDRILLNQHEMHASQPRSPQPKRCRRASDQSLPARNGPVATDSLTTQAGLVEEGRADEREISRGNERREVGPETTAVVSMVEAVAGNKDNGWDNGNVGFVNAWDAKQRMNCPKAGEEEMGKGATKDNIYENKSAARGSGSGNRDESDAVDMSTVDDKGTGYGGSNEVQWTAEMTATVDGTATSAIRPEVGLVSWKGHGDRSKALTRASAPCPAVGSKRAYMRRGTNSDMHDRSTKNSKFLNAKAQRGRKEGSAKMAEQVDRRRAAAAAEGESGQVSSGSGLGMGSGLKPNGRKVCTGRGGACLAALRVHATGGGLGMVVGVSLQQLSRSSQRNVGLATRHFGHGSPNRTVKQTKKKLAASSSPPQPLAAASAPKRQGLNSIEGKKGVRKTSSVRQGWRRESAQRVLKKRIAMQVGREEKRRRGGGLLRNQVGHGRESSSGGTSPSPNLSKNSDDDDDEEEEDEEDEEDEEEEYNDDDNYEEEDEEDEEEEEEEECPGKRLAWAVRKRNNHDSSGKAEVATSAEQHLDRRDLGRGGLVNATHCGEKVGRRNRAEEPVGTKPGSARVCVECGTMKTPLWRNGPRGPKSLCNACGIRFKKERKALALAEAQAQAQAQANAEGNEQQENSSRGGKLVSSAPCRKGKTTVGSAVKSKKHLHLKNQKRKTAGETAASVTDASDGTIATTVSMEAVKADVNAAPTEGCQCSSRQHSPCPFASDPPPSASLQTQTTSDPPPVSLPTQTGHAHHKMTNYSSQCHVADAPDKAVSSAKLDANKEEGNGNATGIGAQDDGHGGDGHSAIRGGEMVAECGDRVGSSADSSVTLQGPPAMVSGPLKRKWKRMMGRSDPAVHESMQIQRVSIAGSGHSRCVELPVNWVAQGKKKVRERNGMAAIMDGMPMDDQHGEGKNNLLLEMEFGGCGGTADEVQGAILLMTLFKGCPA